MTRQRLFRAAVVLGLVAVVWAVVVLWMDGFVFHLGGIRISSRSPRNPALLVLLSLVVAWVLAPSGRRNHALAAEWARLLDVVVRRLPRLPAIRRPAPVIAAIAALWIVIVGFTEGAFVVGGSDSYGYVSQAHLWNIGELRQEPALSRSIAPDLALDVLSPLGYRPSIDERTIAPTYPPGLPIVMAIFERMAGPQSVFWVVPIFGGVLVWATYLLGARAHGPVAGALAAVLVATSPPVLVQLTAAPLSDLPAAAWWAVAMALACLDHRVSALGAGAAAGLAILTRPNLLPLIAIVGGLLIWRLVAARRPIGHSIQHAVLFALFPIAACVSIAAINRVLWGSALMSGYGPLTVLFSVANIWPNLLLYPRLVATQMPVVLLIPIAAFLVWRRPGWRDRVSGDRSLMIAFGACAVAVFLAYVAYPVYDAALNLRFLLPAVPFLLVLAIVSALSLAGRLVEMHRAACGLVLLIVAGYGVDQARELGAFRTDPAQKFAAAGRYLAQRLPERAVVLAMLHSGSATYYSGRPIVRYDLLPPSRLDGVVEALRQRGYVPYLLLDAEERAGFQSRYRGHSSLALLDWPPVFTLNSRDVEVHVYGLPESKARP
jgi:hypothetical protein